MIKSLWHLIPESLRQIARDARFTTRFYRTKLEVVSGLVLFIGNERSGTTLVRTLLDAHSAVVLGNEVHCIKRLQEGKSWKNVVGRILVNSERFARNPVWTGYSYEMTGESQAKDWSSTRIIGDKKAAHTADLFATNPELLPRLFKWAPVPVLFVQCIRNPMDAIATLAQRRSISLLKATQCYFARHETSLAVMKAVGDIQFHRVYLDELITEPESTIRELDNFLGLSTDSSYLAACSALIYDQPHRSRNQVDWPPGLAAYIHSRMGQDSYLARYSKINSVLATNRNLKNAP